MRGAFLGKTRRDLLLAAVAVTAHELIDATSGVDEFLLAGEEWVRRAGDFQLHEGILLAIDFDGFTSCNSRASDESVIIRHIFENNFAVVGWMNIFFHFNKDWRSEKKK